jgi:hypothetical protein
MGNDVFANGREVSCKAADGKSICAFPDVCFTPPQTPVTPPGVPVPYPNTGFASDTTDGSKNVKISGKEVMLKNKSYFKKSTGDEAGCAPKKGFVTSTNTGKVYFTSWSMDVKFEGENVTRFMDMTTHNHVCSSAPANAPPPWMYVDQMAFDQSGGKICEDEKKKAEDACKNSEVTGKGKNAKRDCSKAPDCKKAQQCVLVPKKNDKSFCCSPDNTGHHLVEVHCFTPTAGRGEKSRLPGLDKYNDEDAPCVCASSSRHDGSHGILHAVQGQLEGAFNAAGSILCEWAGAGPLIGKGKRGPAVSKWNYKQARDVGTMAHKTAFPHCNAVCIQNQLDEYHKEKGINDDTALRTDPVSRKGGKLSDDQIKQVQEEVGRIKNLFTQSGSAV